MIRETDTRTDPCPRCFGRGALFVGSLGKLECCPDCRGTGSAIVKEYADWAVAQERERCAKVAEKGMDTSRVDGDRIYCNGWKRSAELIAAAIRARGQSPDTKPMWTDGRGNFSTEETLTCDQQVPGESPNAK